MFTVINDQGREFTIRIVREGDTYGLSRCRVHDRAEPLVEFYDATYALADGFDVEGQFVSRYRASSIAGGDRGLLLDGGNADVWTLDAETMQIVRAFVAGATQ